MSHQALKGKHARATFPLSPPSPEAKAPKGPATKGRAFVLRPFAGDSRPPSVKGWKCIKEARDKAFKAYQDATKEALRIRGGKKGNEAKPKKRARTGACHCHISPRASASPSAPHLSPKTRLITFRRGALILGKDRPGAVAPAKRGVVKGFSKASRLRCAWSFLNAETDWLAMVTLTYPVQPDVEKCREQLRDWLARVNRKFPGLIDYGWCIEGTKAERPHFHVFFGSGGRLGKAIEQERCSKIRRKGRDYEVMRGPVEKACVEAWLGILERDDLMGEEAKTKAFQWGGICERLRMPDAAARYVSKEASKRTQKGESIDLGKGCFWRLARHLKAKARLVSSITLEGRKTLPSFSRIFEKESILDFVDGKAWEQLDCSEAEVRERMKQGLARRRKEQAARLKGWSWYDLF